MDKTCPIFQKLSGVAAVIGHSFQAWLTDLTLFAMSKPDPSFNMFFAFFSIAPNMLCLCSCPSCSLHGSLSKVPDLAGRGGLDLPHPAGTPHGPGQLGGGLLYRHLSTR